MFGKGLTLDFFSDPLVHKTILVTVQCCDSIITFEHCTDSIITVGTEFLCPSHGLDKFNQNTLSDSVTIRKQTNDMSNVEFTTIVWVETLFKNTFKTDWEIVQDVVSTET